MAFLPIGDFYTMGPERAAKAVSLLGVKTVVPMHFGTFPPLVGRPSALQELVGLGRAGPRHQARRHRLSVAKRRLAAVRNRNRGSGHAGWRKAIRSGRISSEEIVSAHLEQIGAMNPHLNAVVCAPKATRR